MHSARSISFSVLSYQVNALSVCLTVNCKASHPHGQRVLQIRIASLGWITAKHSVTRRKGDPLIYLGVSGHGTPLLRALCTRVMHMT